MQILKSFSEWKLLAAFASSPLDEKSTVVRFSSDFLFLDVRRGKQQLQLDSSWDVPRAFPFPFFDWTLNGLKH